MSMRLKQMLPSRYLVATIDSAENKRIGSGGKFLFSLDITFQLAKQTFIRYKQAFIRYKYVFIRYKQAFFGKPKNVTQYQKNLLRIVYGFYFFIYLSFHQENISPVIRVI